MVSIRFQSVFIMMTQLILTHNSQSPVETYFAQWTTPQKPLFQDAIMIVLSAEIYWRGDRYRQCSYSMCPMLLAQPVLNLCEACSHRAGHCPLISCSFRKEKASGERAASL